MSIVPGLGPIVSRDARLRRMPRPALTSGPLLELGRLVRKRPLEMLAIALLVVAALLYPWIWLVGGVITLMSRRWDVPDKWVALIGPPLCALAGLFLLTATAGGNRNLVSAFLHAAAVAGIRLLQLGCLLCAGYLGWRLRRGPRRRRVPPWRRVR